MKEESTQEAEKQLNGKSKDANSKIDAIKELIFGENIQAYNSEFEAVKADIIAKKEELQNLISIVETELLQNIDTLSTDINIRITDLENTLNDKIETLDDKKVNRKLLSDLLIKMGQKISE
ncbi:fructose 1,6-bisphosphatase [Gelatiniphilus marinus]|uniref:Fructose 1,6-bisphosphatase n=1 Tax=Gelatiniphilus marinus TaxID=1759464 RepID=A0ABW5JQ77_9FLAO